jgi:hypothetical protein
MTCSRGCHVPLDTWIRGIVASVSSSDQIRGVVSQTRQKTGRNSHNFFSNKGSPELALFKAQFSHIT